MQTTQYVLGSRTYALRRYPHPGKYAGGLLIDELVNDMTLDGADEETGYADTTGWYGLLRGPIHMEECKGCSWSHVVGVVVSDCQNVAHRYHLHSDEELFLSAIAGAIVTEDSQGFVSVEYFETATALNEAWADIVRAVDAVLQTEESR